MSNTFKKNNGKIIFKTIFFTILIEFIIVWILWLIIYKNYKKISSAQSWIANISNLNNIKVKKIDINTILKKTEKNANWQNNYNWLLWNIKINTNTNNTSNTNNIEYSYEKKISINLNENNIKLFSILNVLNKNQLLDQYIYDYMIKKYLTKNNKEKTTNKKDNIWNTVNRILKFAITIEKIDIKTAKNVQNEINQEITNNFSNISKKIINKKIKELNSLLKNIETIKNIPNNLYWKTEIIDNQKFQYIINKLLSNDYYNNIKEASRKTWIDKKLIISAIAVEQLRYLNSNRAFAKKLLMQNRFLTNFSKFSYWLGWIKVPTFIKINQRLKEYEPFIYNKYFLYYDKLSQKTDEEINTQKGLEQQNSNNENQDLYNKDKIIELLKKHDISTLYTAGLLLSIIDKRKKYWINISYKPWIILTLYNMWNIKTPHKNPWIGGALIPVLENKKKYFWEIWSIFYNYIDFYLDLK